MNLADIPEDYGDVEDVQLHKEIRIDDLSNIDAFFDFLGIECTEIRIFGKALGYFDDWSKLRSECEKWDGKVDGIYFTSNKLNGSLPHDVTNDLKPRTDGTKDTHIESYKCFKIDVDRKKPLGFDKNGRQIEVKHEHAATTKELETLANIKNLITNELAKSDIQFAQSFSGNGYAIYIPVESQNDIESAKRLANSILSNLKAYFSDVADVDTTVSNPARVMRLPGTLNCKHKNQQTRCFAVVPNVSDYEVPTLEDVSNLFGIKFKVKNENAEAVRIINPNRQQYNSVQRRYRHETERMLSDAGFDSESYMKCDKDSDYIKYHITCPFNEEHKGKDAYVFENSEGYPGFTCSHNSCSNNGFNEFAKKCNLVSHSLFSSNNNRDQYSNIEQAKDRAMFPSYYVDRCEASAKQLLGIEDDTEDLVTDRDRYGRIVDGEFKSVTKIFQDENFPNLDFVAMQTVLADEFQEFDSDWKSDEELTKSENRMPVQNLVRNQSAVQGIIDEWNEQNVRICSDPQPVSKNDTRMRVETAEGIQLFGKVFEKVVCAKAQIAQFVEGESEEQAEKRGKRIWAVVNRAAAEIVGYTNVFQKREMQNASKRRRSSNFSSGLHFINKGETL